MGKSHIPGKKSLNRLRRNLRKNKIKYNNFDPQEIGEELGVYPREESKDEYNTSESGGYMKKKGD